MISKTYKSRVNRLHSFWLEDESFGKLVEVGRFGQSDDHFGVDCLSVSPFDVFWSDVWDRGQSILDKELSELADQWYCLSHTLNLSWPMFLDHKLCKEQSLVQSCVSSDSEDVGFVEFRALVTHCSLLNLICLLVYDYKSFITLNMWKIIFD